MSIKEMDAMTVRGLVAEGKAVLVDVREVVEHARERICGAYHLPLSMFDPARLPEHGDKIVVYLCATGNRTHRFGPQLRAATEKARDVCHLSGGIMAWKIAGFETETA